jgi:hypothetical protein
MRTFGQVVSATGILLCWGSLAYGEYPMKLVLDATAKTATASVASKVSISVERLMEESRRVRVNKGLQSDGYPGFLKVLRALPPVGTIGLAGRQVEIRYAHEQPQGERSRLVLVADAPLFFLGGDPGKKRAGYELTIVEITIGADGAVDGTMAGAARVKPGPEGTPVLDDFAEVRVQLAGRINRP